jgi:HD-GYP domain-containing protein (c-di-GMP phosphodiesterase class II)
MRSGFQRFASGLRLRAMVASEPRRQRKWLTILVAVAIAPILILLVATKALGMAIGYGAVAEIMLFPILVGAAWGGGLGALTTSLAALVLVSPLAIHETLGLAGFVSPASSWAFQGVIIVAFALTSGLLFSKSDRLSLRDEQSSSPDTAFEGYERVLASFANTVEVRDHHTQGHCERVARNALIMGQALAISSREMSVLYWAARLHDLGKIAVPEYVLLKSGRLTEDEFAEIRRHPSYGADLLASVSISFRPIADVVRAHHERWDGLGYPLGLKGEEIPRLARIIAIVDVFEALTSERPYRSPMPSAQALQYILNGAGTQFDPDLVSEFERLNGIGKIECAIGPAYAGTYEANSADGVAYRHA